MILLSHHSLDAKFFVRVELMLPPLWVLQVLITPRKESCKFDVAECGTKHLGSDCFRVVPKPDVEQLHFSIFRHEHFLSF